MASAADLSKVILLLLVYCLLLLPFLWGGGMFGHCFVMQKYSFVITSLRKKGLVVLL